MADPAKDIHIRIFVVSLRESECDEVEYKAKEPVLDAGSFAFANIFSCSSVNSQDVRPDYQRFVKYPVAYPYRSLVVTLLGMRISRY